MNYTFPKTEKLCGQERIAALYKKGKRFTAFPLRVTYICVEVNEETTLLDVNSNFAPKVLIWAPKSLFKRANKRNHLRRLMREAYRLNAAPLKEYCAEHHIHLQVAFNYMATEEYSFAKIEKAMVKAIGSLMARTGEH